MQKHILQIVFSSITGAMAIQMLLLWYFQECNYYEIAMSVHAGVFIFSVLFIWVLSNSLIRWAIFPYSAWLVYTDHHKSNNRRLADEMVRLYREFQGIIREDMMLFNTNKDKPARNAESEDKVESMANYEYKDKIQIIQKLIETNELFMEVNSKLIDDDIEFKNKQTGACSKRRKFRTKKFKEITNIMKKASQCFRELQVQPIGSPPGATVSLFDHFVEVDDDVRHERDAIKMEEIQQTSQYQGIRSRPSKIYRQLPQVESSEKNLVIFNELLKISEIYIENVTKAVRPCVCFKSRHECCFHFESVFGETEQMGSVLAKNFEGEHRMIFDKKHNPNSIIDSMFFTYNGVVPDDNDYKCDYKDRTTFIICNPNAMFYQHMINYPHAYYLRFFQQRSFNVMIWNYRGYGLSKGSGCCGESCCATATSPSNIKKDAESVLRYMRQQIGLRGKIGVYGRSLGGIAATHLMSYVDMVIVDRSFANFDDVIDRKFYGKKAVCLYKFALCCQKANNAESLVGGMNVEVYLGSEDEDDKEKIISNKGFAPVVLSDQISSAEQPKLEDNENQDTWGPLQRPCYKVITCDIKDEILDLQSSLMIGVARQACIVRRQQQMAITDHNLARVGLLTDEECKILTNSIKNLMSFDYALFEFIQSRIDSAKKAVEIEGQTQISMQDAEVENSRALANTLPQVNSDLTNTRELNRTTVRPPSIGSLGEITAEGNGLQGIGQGTDIKTPENMQEKIDEIVNEGFIQIDAEKIVINNSSPNIGRARINNAKIVDLSNAMDLKNKEIVNKDHINSFKNLTNTAMKIFSSQEKSQLKQMLKYVDYSNLEYKEPFRLTLGLIDMQVLLSKLIQKVQQTKGGNVHLHNLFMLNKDTEPIEIQNWISLIEVFGTLPEQSLLKPDIETLQEQRLRGVNNLRQTNARIKSLIKSVQEKYIDLEDEEKHNKYNKSGDRMFDQFWNNCCKQIFADMVTLSSLFNKIATYFVFKEKQDKKTLRSSISYSASNLQLVGDESSVMESEGIELTELPIFDGLEAPSLYEVGNIVNLNCGHAQRPSDAEANLLHQHLVEAGLIPGTAHLRSRALSERTHRARTISIKKNFPNINKEQAKQSRSRQLSEAVKPSPLPSRLNN